MLGQTRGKERGQDGTAIPRARYAHGQALILGWIPAANHGKGYGKAGARDSQHATHQKKLSQTISSKPPGEKRQQGKDDSDAACPLRPKMVARDAQGNRSEEHTSELQSQF